MKRILLITALCVLAHNNFIMPASSVIAGKVSTPANSTELQTIIANTPNVVIDFSATWCEPCKRMEPILHKLAEEFTNITFIKVDVYTFDNVSAIHNVRSMPTFVFFKNGKKVGDITGAQTPKEFKSLLTKYF